MINIATILQQFTFYFSLWYNNGKDYTKHRNSILLHVLIPHLFIYMKKHLLILFIFTYKIFDFFFFLFSIQIHFFVMNCDHKMRFEWMNEWFVQLRCFELLWWIMSRMIFIKDRMWLNVVFFFLIFFFFWLFNHIEQFKTFIIVKFIILLKKEHCVVTEFSSNCLCYFSISLNDETSDTNCIEGV